MREKGQSLRTWIAFGLSIVGATTGLIAFLEARHTREVARRLESDQYLYEAWDLMGGRSGTETIVETEFVEDAANLEMARRLIEQALLIDPTYARAHNRLGSYWIARREPEKAVEAFGKAIELDAGYASAHLNKGNVLVRIGRAREALPLYKRAVELEPADPVAYQNLVVTYLELGFYGAALDRLSTWANPRISDKLLNELVTWFLEGSGDELVEEFREEFPIVGFMEEGEFQLGKDATPDQRLALLRFIVEEQIKAGKPEELHLLEFEAADEGG